MDPDQAAAAGEHHLHGNHLTDATSSEPSGGESWPRALLRRGWGLSRKVAIVGAAAAAAPVVAPPVLFLSAAGLALSVPFAAYLASLAATDRLMAALLPSSSSPPAEPAVVHLHGEDYSVQQEFFDASEEPGRHEPPVLYPCSKSKTEEEEEDDDAVQDETVSFQEPVQESMGSNNGDTFHFQDSTTTMGTVSLASDVSQFLMPILGGKDTMVDERAVQDGDAAVHQLGQDSPLVLNMEEKTEEPTFMEGKEYSTKDKPLQDFNVSGTRVPVFTDEDSVFTSKVEGEADAEAAAEEAAIADDIDTNVAETRTLPLNHLVACLSEEVAVETAYDGEMQGIAVVEDIVRDPSDVNIEEDMQHHDQVVDVCAPNIPTFCNETSQQPDQAIGLGYPLMNEGFVGGKEISGDKHLYTEAQLRDQLETVRAITGYRSPASSTLAGELAGLYLFVGVELPVSSNDASDLVEINAKLRTLKSIIGIN